MAGGSTQLHGVASDIVLPTFGTAYNPLPRDFAIVFEFLWGKQYHTLH